jgi:NADH-quinone oxidoreductase subunit A
MQIVVAVGMGVGMVSASWFIGRHRKVKAKLETYECGIPAEGNARGRFSVRFYMVAMLFILFDVEAVFMMPWAVIYRQLPKITGSLMFGFWEIIVYLGFIAVGLFYIVKKGILDWATDKGDL